MPVWGSNASTVEILVGSVDRSIESDSYCSVNLGIGVHLVVPRVLKEGTDHILQCYRNLREQQAHMSRG